LQTKKLVTIPVLLVIALTLIGYAVANWTATLSITGTVTTATLDLKFSLVYIPTETDPLGVGSAIIEPVGSTTGDINTITLTVQNAYPSYTVTVGFQIENIGTISAEFIGFSLNGGPAAYDDVTGWSASLPGGTMNFRASDSEGEMVPIGATRTYSISLQVTNDAKFGETYAFTIGAVFKQGV
jgi:hypothetical protein